MKRAIQLIVFVPIAVVIIAISVANRHEVLFSLDPFDAEDPALSFEVPLFWLLFAAAVVGLLLGGAATWVRQGRWRRAARTEHAEVERLRREKRSAEPAITSLPPPGDRNRAS